jgi:hypothetical protein
MNLGFYIDSQGQSEVVNAIYNTLNNFVDNKTVDNASLFYNDIDHNPIQPKFGCFNSTDVWYFTGNLIVVGVKNAISIKKVINKFKPYFLYTREKNSVLQMIHVSKYMDIVAANEEDASYIKRVTGVDAKIVPDGDISKITEILDE